MGVFPETSVFTMFWALFHVFFLHCAENDFFAVFAVSVGRAGILGICSIFGPFGGKYSVFTALSALLLYFCCDFCCFRSWALAAVFCMPGFQLPAGVGNVGIYSVFAAWAKRSKACSSSCPVVPSLVGPTALQRTLLLAEKT